MLEWKDLELDFFVHQSINEMYIILRSNCHDCVERADMLAVGLERHFVI